MFPSYFSGLHRSPSSSSSSSAFPSCVSLGFIILSEIFAYVIVFIKSNHLGSYIPSSCMVHAGCVFVAGIHPSRHERQDLSSPCNGMHVCTD